MNAQHLVLAAAWIVYCVLHSVFAAGSVKAKVQQWLGQNFRYYRFGYTVFAFIGLVAILLYQVSIDSPLLFRPGFAVQLISALFAAIGASMMMLNIIKYFLQLSGVRWLVSATVDARLERGGLHRYVRHPLYFSTFLFIWSLWVIYPFLSLLIADLIITIYTLVALRFEEQKLLAEFGEEYRSYQKEVPMIWPRIVRRTTTSYPQ